MPIRSKTQVRSPKALLVPIHDETLPCQEDPSMRDHRPTNPEMLNTIGYLKRAGRQHQAPLWLTVASFLGKSRRTRIVLNLGQVSRLAKPGDVIVVPGKVLGSGIPKEKLTIAAFKFSPSALVIIENAGGRCSPLFRHIE